MPLLFLFLNVKKMEAQINWDEDKKKFKLLCQLHGEKIYIGIFI